MKLEFNKNGECDIDEISFINEDGIHNKYTGDLAKYIMKQIYLGISTTATLEEPKEI
jgi:hypothetical protein